MPATRRPHDHAFIALEHLEKRVVLASTDVAIVGLLFQQEAYGEWERPTPKFYSSYVMEGSVSDANLLTYRMRKNGAGGAGPASAERTSQLHLRDDGSFDYATARWPSASGEEGAQFLTADGYGMGWWQSSESTSIILTGGGGYEFVTRAEEQLIVPLAPQTSLRAVDGSWDVTIHRRNLVTGQDVAITGSLNINADSRGLSFHLRGTDTPMRTDVVGYTGGTRFRTDDGQMFFLSADRATLIFADLDSSDGTIHIGVAVLSRPTIAEEDVVATYLITSNRGNLNPSWGSRLQLHADGTYTSHRIRIFPNAGGAGGSNAPEVGEWRIRYGNELTLRPSNWDPERQYAVSRNGGTIVQMGTTHFVVGRRDILEPVRHDPVEITSSLSDDGRAVVFIDRSNAPWEAIDIVDATGGPEPTGDLVSWFDPATGRAHAAANTARGVTIYSENEDGSWSAAVLGETLGTGTVLVGNLASTLGPGGRMNLFGLTDAGKLVRYVDGLGGSAGWTEWQISRDRLDPLGVETPTFAGDLVAYAQPWGGLNVAGIDTDGDLRVIWTARTAGGWFVANLTEETGAGNFVGDLAVAATPRGHVRLVSSNADGELVVLYWNRAPGSTWRSKVVESMHYTQNGTLAAAFVPLTGQLHIAFMREGSEHVLMHAIPPAYFTSSSLTYKTTGVTGIADDDDLIVDGLSVRLGADGIVSIFGRNAADETLRFQHLGGAVRTYENLSEIT